MKHVVNKDWEINELKRELELDAVPAAVDRKLRQLFAELPDEMPAKKRAGRTVLKSAGYAMSGLAAALLMLFGLNALNPALAESIPGIGSLFSLMNDHSMQPMGGGVGTYEEMVKKLGIAADAAGDSGYGLTMDEAFCDGEYLYLTMELEKPQEAEQYEAVGLEGAQLLVDGEKAEHVSGGGQDAESGMDLASVWKLPEQAENGQELEVFFTADTLWAHYPNYKLERRGDSIPVGFSAGFTVTADTTGNNVAEVTAEDNGVKLYSFTDTPGYFQVEMEIPFWGRTGDELLGGGPVKGYAMLFTESGRELRHNSGLTDYDFANESNSETIRGVWAFNSPGAQEEKVILRVLDQSPDTISSITMEPVQPVVFAEFTIDRKRGTVKATSTYEKLGYEKADTQEYQNTVFHPDFTGGYLVQDIVGCSTDMWHESQQAVSYVALYGDVEYQPVEARFYRKGELLGAVKARPEKDFNDPDFAGGSAAGAYRDETGFYSSFAAEDSTDGLAQYGLIFCYYYPEGTETDQYGNVAKEAMVDRIDLVNSETGETILQDMRIGDTSRK